MLLSLVMVLLWAVCAQADVAVQPDFDLQKFAGMWQVMGGASNCPVFQAMKDIMQTSAAVVTPLPGGDMRILTGFPFPEECKKVDRVYKKTEQPGRFSHADDMSKRDVCVMDTDYDNYAFVYTFKEVEEEPSTTTIQIYTRHPDVSKDIMEKFKKHCHDVGLTDDLMVMLPKSDECAKALSILKKNDMFPWGTWFIRDVADAQCGMGGAGTTAQNAKWQTHLWLKRM